MKNMILRALVIGAFIGSYGLNAQEESLALRELRAEGRIPAPRDGVCYSMPVLDNARIKEHWDKFEKLKSNCKGDLSRTILSSNFSIRDQEDSEELFGILLALCDRNQGCRQTILKPYILAMHALAKEYYPKTYTEPEEVAKPEKAGLPSSAQ
jgi:hypothetical protein